MLLTDFQIEELMARGELEIKNFDKKYLEPASYDVRLGKKGIKTTAIKLEEIKKAIVEKSETINIEEKGSLSIPAGGLALVTTYESFKLSERVVGHVGMSTYYVRKGVGLLSGLQIDPGFEGVLVLAICNYSPRTISIDYLDRICTVEFHQLNETPKRKFKRDLIAEQKNGEIPRIDRDYLRTIEVMSISDLTTALLTLSQNVDNLTKYVRYLWIPIILTFLVVLLSYVR